MRTLSLQEKEQQIIATLSICSNEISNKNNLKKLYESLDFQNIEENNQIKLSDYRNNKYVYLNEVNKFLNNCNSEILVNLNESFNINSFKNDLNQTLIDLSKINDFNKLDCISPSILKTKLLSNNPINVLGFNIVNNLDLQNELKENFKLNMLDIISIIFDKTNKQIFFVFVENLIVYEIKTNYLGKFIGELSEPINEKNYLPLIKYEINANIIQLFINTKKMPGLKFQDNLFQDKQRTAENNKKAQYRDNNLFVKS